MKASEGDIVVSIVVTREGNQYSSWSPELDIASCGDTPEEAVKNLREAIQLYLEAIEEEGIREAVFKEKGIKIVGAEEPVVPSSFVTQYRQKVRVLAR
ncbi:MAG: type II toxin-antitoxin system HicB family antitoxin [Chloroflexota bacterium]|nr:type II toxin-antitoxin system HicB family antitoxin [Chloroflexota bacterium]